MAATVDAYLSGTGAAADAAVAAAAVAAAALARIFLTPLFGDFGGGDGVGGGRN